MFVVQSSDRHTHNCFHCFCDTIKNLVVAADIESFQRHCSCGSSGRLSPIVIRKCCATTTAAIILLLHHNNKQTTTHLGPQQQQQGQIERGALLSAASHFSNKCGTKQNGERFFRCIFTQKCIYSIHLHILMLAQGHWLRLVHSH